MHLDRGGTIAETAGNVRSNLPATRQPVSQPLLHIKQYQDERLVASMRGWCQPESRAAQRDRVLLQGVAECSSTRYGSVGSDGLVLFPSSAINDAIRGGVGGAGGVAQGGGFYANNSTVTLDGVTVASDRALVGTVGRGGAGSFVGGEGGAGGDAFGGGLYVAGGTVSLTNSTLSNDSAQGGIGGKGGKGGGVSGTNGSGHSNPHIGNGGVGGYGGNGAGGGLYVAEGTVALDNNLFSFTSTCQRLGVEPWAYLQDLLTRLPATPTGQLDELLPDQWQVARHAQMATPVAPVTEITTSSPESAS